ncbi:hypothetical protein PVAND_011082 [Polypedilum vanderplanki]|uniref:Uncharacterized protein n=1 Tax=Polypedilum vanderplanki TaxID=319348 RepID=A0A9J6CI16_POLVA|nr:hypothetical protein PVAND_011082 [Polypedilum vanderplanki]
MKNTKSASKIVIKLTFLYFVLTLLFFAPKKDYIFNDRHEKFNDCSYENTCLPFCEETNYENFTDDYIKKNFPIDDFLRLKYEFLKEYELVKFKIIKHIVKCGKYEEKTMVANSSEIEIFRDGRIKYKYDVTPDYKFCLEPYEKANEMKLKIQLCLKNIFSWKIIHYILLIIAAIILTIPTSFYAFTKEVRQTSHGKLCISILILQIYMILIYPLEQTDYDYNA